MSTTPPGWFPIEGSPGMLRWWDGTRWTDDTIQQAAAPAIVGDRSSRLPMIRRVVLFASAAGLAGSFLPWLTVPHFGTIGLTGFDGRDGKITAGAAIGVMLLAYFGLTNRNRGLLIIGIVADLIGLAASILGWIDVNDKMRAADGHASVGYGLYFCLAGFAIGTVVLIVALREVISAKPTTPAQPVSGASE